MNFGAMGGGGMKGMFGGGGAKGILGGGADKPQAGMDQSSMGTGLAASVGVNPLIAQMWGAGGQQQPQQPQFQPFVAVPPPIQQPFQMQQPQSLSYGSAPGQFQAPTSMGDYRGGLYRSIYGY